MMNSKEFSFRVEPRTYRIVKQRVVRGTPRFTSPTEFARKATAAHVKEIHGDVAGGDLIHDLCELLVDIEAIEEDLPTVQTDARLEKQNLDRVISFEATRKTVGVIDDIRDETGVRSSVVCRMCLFRSLYRLVEGPDFYALHDDEEDLILSTWANIETNLISVESKFHEILHRRFVLKPDTTTRIVESDFDRFERFASRYAEELMGTDQYRGLISRFGERTFRNVENAIEDITEITPRPARVDSFLEKKLEETK